MQPNTSQTNTSKMKASELRMGNILEYHGQQVIVLEIKRDSAEFGYFTYSIGFERFYLGHDFPNPIPLTEEWLVKAGFDDIDSGYLSIELPNCGGGRICLWKMNYGGYPVLHSIGIGNKPTGWLREVKYVHTLQNLYFALTQTELTP